MPSKKLTIMSLSIEPEMQDLLKAHAGKSGLSVSKVIRNLIERYLIQDDTVQPIILKVPVSLKADPSGLQKWLDTKSAAIVKALTATPKS